jgi:hypothetical protein
MDNWFPCKPSALDRRAFLVSSALAATVAKASLASQSAPQLPGASQASAWPTKHSLLTTNYEPKSPSRRAGDRPDEKIVIVRGALQARVWLSAAGMMARFHLAAPSVAPVTLLRMRDELNDTHLRGPSNPVLAM